MAIETKWYLKLKSILQILINKGTPHGNNKPLALVATYPQKEKKATASNPASQDPLSNQAMR